MFVPPAVQHSMNPGTVPQVGGDARLIKAPLWRSCCQYVCVPLSAMLAAQHEGWYSAGTWVVVHV
jgi:hypothetical protein